MSLPSCDGTSTLLVLCSSLASSPVVVRGVVKGPVAVVGGSVRLVSLVSIDEQLLLAIEASPSSVTGFFFFDFFAFLF